MKPLGKLRTSPITNKTTIARQITGATKVKVAITAAETSSNRATKKFDIPADTIEAPARIAAMIEATTPEVAPPPIIASDQFRTGDEVSSWDDITKIPATTAAGVAITSRKFPKIGTQNPINSKTNANAKIVIAGQVLSHSVCSVKESSPALFASPAASGGTKTFSPQAALRQTPITIEIISWVSIEIRRSCT